VTRNAIIFHGTGGDPQNCWYPWLGARLEARGYAVEIPHYPGLDPYGCDAAQGRSMFERLGGTQIVRNEGHFGDIDDPYPSFELVDRLMD
jgi:hypothetical protein